MLDALARWLNLGDDRRGQPRIYDRPLRINIDEGEFTTDNWSMTGFQLNDFTSYLDFDGKVLGYQVNDPKHHRYFQAELVWRAPDNSAGFRFINVEGIKISLN